MRASEDENPELFWALHGGGNFGIAVELKFALHELPAATLGLLLWPAERGAEIVRVYRDLIDAGASEELGGGALHITGPPEEFVPEELQGQLVCGVAVVYAGAPQEAAKAVWSVEHANSLPDEAIDGFCERAYDMVVPSPSQHILFPWGGAVQRQGSQWPLPHRKAKWAVHPLGLWEDVADDAQAIAWARDTCSDFEPWATGDVYLNFVGDEGQDRVVAGFGEDNYRRMAAVKAQFDPDNVFRLGHNVTPAAA